MPRSESPGKTQELFAASTKRWQCPMLLGVSKHNISSIRNCYVLPYWRYKKADLRGFHVLDDTADEAHPVKNIFMSFVIGGTKLSEDQVAIHLMSFRIGGKNDIGGRSTM